MRKVIAALAAAFLFFACDNGSVEPNPYPDGVYPFEVSDVRDTSQLTDWRSISWVNPDDGGFKKARFELFVFFEYPPPGDEELIGYELLYSSVTGERGIDYNRYIRGDIVLENNNISYEKTKNSAYVKLLIKCVDKFGNVSKGVTYLFWS